MTIRKGKPVPGFRAVKAIKMGPGREYAAGDDLPLPVGEFERGAYARLLAEGAIQHALNGSTSTVRKGRT